MRTTLLLLTMLLLAQSPVSASEPVSEVHGTVLDPSGHLVEGAVVALRFHDSEPSFDLINHFPPVMTDSSGKFSLPVYEWSEGMKVIAWKAGFVATNSAKIARQAHEVEIRMERGTVITFEITKGKEPVADAQICPAETSSYIQQESQRHLLVSSDALLTCVRTAPSGKAEAHLRPGKYFVGVRARGAQWLLKEIVVGEEDSLDRSDLAPSFDVRGRVVRSNGTPVAGLELRVQGPKQPGEPLTTAADGSFLIEDLAPGEFLIVIQKQEELLLHEVDFTVPLSRPLEIRLPPTGSMHVRFVDSESGAPIVPELVDVRSDTGESSPILEPTSTLSLPDVPEGEYTVSASSAQYPSVETKARVASGGISEVVLSMIKGLMLSGVVLDHDTPVAEAHVIFIPDDLPTESRARWRAMLAFRQGATTDERGHFALGGLARQKGSIRVDAIGFRSWSAAVTDQESRNLVVNLDRGLAVKGVVLRKSVPVADARILVKVVGDEFDASQESLSDARGAFELTGLTPGPHQILVGAGGEVHQLGTMTIQANVPLALELEGDPASLEGTVTGILSTEREGARVLLGDDEKPGVVQTDSSYRVTGITPGEHRIVVIVNAGSSRRICHFPSLTIGPAESAKVDLDCGAELEITGRVTTGKTVVPNPRVQFEGGDHPVLITVKGDDSGEYRVRVPRGAYRIQVEAPGSPHGYLERTISTSERIDFDLR